MADAKPGQWPVWPVYNDDDKNAVKHVMDSGQLFAAREVRKFEEVFAKYLGISHAKGVGNATQGLHLALAALGIGINDEVIVTPYSWISSASCVLMQNAVPVFSDIEPETFGLDPGQVGKNISARTKALIFVHMFGYPGRIREIAQIARDKGIYLIEDASHVPGARADGRNLGTFGDIGVFSLHQRKTLSVGDGGIVVTDNKSIDRKIYKLRSFGDDELSYNYRMTEFAAAIGQTRLKHLDEENHKRALYAEYISKKISDLDGINAVMPRKGDIGVFYKMLFDFNPEKYRINLKEFVVNVNHRGIPVEKTWEPLHKHPHFNPVNPPARGCPWLFDSYEGRKMKNTGYSDLCFPVAEEYLNDRIFELPIHSHVSWENIDKAIHVIKLISKKYSL